VRAVLAKSTTLRRYRPPQVLPLVLILNRLAHEPARKLRTRVPRFVTILSRCRGCVPQISKHRGARLPKGMRLRFHGFAFRSVEFQGELPARSAAAAVCPS